MNRTGIFSAMLLLLTAGICYGQQQSGSSEIYVESWKAGNKIREQVLNFNLDSSQPDLFGNLFRWQTIVALNDVKDFDVE